jgi:hypothetical protein
MDYKKMNYHTLSPLEFSGSVHGDFGFVIDGVKSERGYVSRIGAYNAMCRKMDKMSGAPKVNKNWQ